jgi:hypothetical protein
MQWNQWFGLPVLCLAGVTLRRVTRDEAVFEFILSMSVQRKAAVSPACSAAGRLQASGRILEIERLRQDCAVGEVAMLKLNRPVEVNGQRAAALRICACRKSELHENMELCFPSFCFQRRSPDGRRRPGSLQIASLLLENVALRHQLGVLHRSVKRPKLTAPDRLLWSWLCGVWGNWHVKPETVIAWHRRGFRLFWMWKIRRGQRGSQRRSPTDPHHEPRKPALGLASHSR